MMTDHRQIMLLIAIEDLEYLRAQPSQERLAALTQAAERARDQWAEEVARLEAKFEGFRRALVDTLGMGPDATAEQIVTALSWTDSPPVSAAWSQDDGPPTQSMTPVEQPAAQAVATDE